MNIRYNHYFDLTVGKHSNRVVADSRDCILMSVQCYFGVNFYLTNSGPVDTSLEGLLPQLISVITKATATRQHTAAKGY